MVQSLTDVIKAYKTHLIENSKSGRCLMPDLCPLTDPQQSPLSPGDQAPICFSRLFVPFYSTYSTILTFFMIFQAFFYERFLDFLLHVLSFFLYLVILEYSSKIFIASFFPPFITELMIPFRKFYLDNTTIKKI